MLARLKQTDNAAPDTSLAEMLVLPRKPDLIREADIRWRAAVEARELAQEQHRAASVRYAQQKPGEQVEITRAEVDEFGKGIRPLQEAEDVAASARKQARDDYQAKVNAALSGPISDLHRDVAEKINDLEALLALGVKLNSEATAAGAKLPGRLPAACGALIQHLMFFRGVFNKIPVT
jgi:hypothetical protein